MYFRVEYNDIRKLAKFVGRVSATGTDAITSSVVLSTTPEGIHMASLAPDIWAEGWVPAEIEFHGQVTLSGSWFTKVLSALPLGARDIVEVAEANDELDIQTGAGRHHRQIPLIPADDPPMHATVDADSIVVGPDTCDWIKLAQFAASTDAWRQALNGVHLYPGGIVATDSYKFVLIDFDWPKIKPTTISLDYVKLFPDADSYGDGDILMGTTDRIVKFAFGEMVLIGSKVMAEYPDINLMKGILPSSDTKFQFEVEVAELKRILAALAPFGVTMQGAVLHPDGFIRLVTPDSGMAEDKIESGKVNLDRPVSLNIEFLRQVERLVRDEDVCTFRFNQEKPDQLPYTITKDNVTVGCMPMRVI